ncbi:ADP-forming succinate--CoA ligase subunit beta, partial [Candidatus Bipolaricaulota bacterium]|nr:ADP-forming succinate--CoA ligase subunit beta [Candidatus Bipolaricaulota bacterium]
ERLEDAGIPIPAGKVCETPEEVGKIAQELGGSAVVKAQVPVGGRGKAGGIKITDSPDEAAAVARSLLGSELKGEVISRLLVVEPVEVDKEYYISVILDRGRKGPVIILSPEGGVDIEQVAEERPEKIFQVEPDPLIGLQPFMTREIIYRSGMDKDMFKPLYGVIEKLYSAYVRFGATLVEINPLASTQKKELLALDSKVKIDDDSRSMQDVQALLPESEGTGDRTELELRAEEIGLQYVELEGNIGIIGNGAGLVMSTLDVISQKGGRPANFLDIGGGADADLVSQAFQVVTSKEGLNGIFVNIFGGITRCDEIARGLVEALRDESFDLPVVVRLTGTNEEAGRKILKDHGINAVSTLDEGASQILESS